MMKGEYEVHGGLDLIQTHDQWEYNPIGFGFTPSVGHHAAGNPTTLLRPAAADMRYTHVEKLELSEWMEQVVKNLSEDGYPAAAEHGEWRPRKSARREYGSGMMNEDPHWVGVGVQQQQQEGIRRCSSGESSSVVGIGGASSRGVDEHGLGQLTLLLECAVAISVENLAEANRMLLELAQMASPYGPSCAERVVAYFAQAMASRVINSWLGICTPLVAHRSILSAFHVFNNVSPFIKFAHFTSNQAILEAFHQRDRVHIIDLDIMQGLQWPALFHILATRMEGPPYIRMTGVGAAIDVLEETGRQLSSFAKRLGLSFEFHPIAAKFGDVEASMLQGRRAGETVAVHWLQHSLYDATGPDWKTMRLIQQVGPRVVTLVEQDLAHGGTFLDRFVGSLHYYSTVFDSLGASLGCDDPNRHRVEQCLLSREINNILAIGGPARSGEDKFGSWRAELARHGFAQVAMSGNSMAQAQLILNMFPPTHGYTLHQGDGTLRLGWKETSLYTASSWTTTPFR
ncbi:hypothetical protein ACLOJK_011442 [Asimina triloba]